jgi:hypothetical protein
MLFVAAIVLTFLGLLCGYIAVGLARVTERTRGFVECEERLAILRRQLTRRMR